MNYYSSVLGRRGDVFIIHWALFGRGPSPYYPSLSIIDGGYPTTEFLRCSGTYLLRYWWEKVDER